MLTSVFFKDLFLRQTVDLASSELTEIPLSLLFLLYSLLSSIPYPARFILLCVYDTCGQVPQRALDSLELEAQEL